MCSVDDVINGGWVGAVVAWEASTAICPIEDRSKTAHGMCDLAY